MKDRRLVLCPFCDQEHWVSKDERVLMCQRCGEIFDISEEDFEQAEFWHNPATSPSF